MARPIEGRYASALGTFRQKLNTPGNVVTPTPYWTPPKGLNTGVPLSRLPNEYASDIVNLMLDDTVMSSRKGLTEVGTSAGTAMAVLSFVSPDRIGFLFRIRLTGMDEWNGTAWVPVNGMFFTGSTRDHFTWTGWGDELLLCNGIDRIRSYNTKTGIATVLLESFPCKHLTTFDNRVIASATLEGNFQGARQRWSVKNDNTDWTSETTLDGIGAGFEDLRGTPGGYVDQLMGTFPLSDDTALVVRENSLWLQFVTGNVDTPFRYSKLATEMGSKARRSIVSTPFGVTFLSLTDVVTCTQSGPSSIGAAVRRRSIVADVTDPEDVVALYDPRRSEYRLKTNTSVWRYNWIDQGWTRDRYATAIKQMSFVDYRVLGLRIGELVGTIGGLSGRIGDLVRNNADEGVHMMTSLDTVLREDSAALDDNGIAAPIVVATGLLAAGSTLDRSEIIEAQLEYEAETEQLLAFEYSYDNLTWTTYSQATITPTAGPTILTVRRTLNSHNLQIRVTSLTLGKLKIIGFYPFIVRGARVNP